MMTLLLDLGDDPPRDRTAELRVLGFPRRHLGSVQMTTDTALGVTKRVVEDRGSCLESPPTGQETDRFVCAVTVPLEQIPYVVRSPDPVPAMVVKLPLPGLPGDPLQCARKRRNAFPCVASIPTTVLTDSTNAVASGYMIVPGTKDEPLLPPGMKAHLHAELNESIDFA